MLSRTIVEHDCWEMLAEEAPSEPEKVQEVPRLSMYGALGAGVIVGSDKGEAYAKAAKTALNTTLAIIVRHK